MTAGLRYCPREKNCSVAASPRIWSSALCKYARYWISGTGSRPVTPKIITSGWQTPAAALCFPGQHRRLGCGKAAPGLGHYDAM
ncbi:MAG TPA: hypothetical protein VE733_18670 [Streptosporangiaceae bacterium]|jgi:hypothetical protein|nr:hypothetical protein [Streptosporangiaceae bacterium]